MYVNGSKVSTTFVSSSLLRISKDDVSDGDTIEADITGSSNTIFRTSNPYVYTAPVLSTEQ